MTILRVFLPVPGIAVVALLSVHAAAQSCSGYLFPGDVASVVTAKINVVRAQILDGNSCPNPSASCKGHEYLVQNDVDFRSPRTKATYSCVAFFNGKRQTTGWVETMNLCPIANSNWQRRFGRAHGNASPAILP